MFNIDVFDERYRAAPPSYPIATAPIKPGVEFGPCLIYPCPADFPPAWAIAEWSGTEWLDFCGAVCEATHWAPLPAPFVTIEHER